MSISSNINVLIHNGFNSIQYLAPNNKILVTENSNTFTLPLLSSPNTYQDTTYLVTFSDGSSTRVNEKEMFLVRPFGLKDFSFMSIPDIYTTVTSNQYKPLNQGFYCCFGNCNYTGYDKVSPNTLEVQPIDYPWNFSITSLGLFPSYWYGVLINNGLLDKQEPRVYLDHELLHIMNNQSLGVRQHHIIDDHPSDYIYEFRSDRYITNRSLLSIDLENLGLLYTNKCNRFIHDSYIYTSIENRIALLRGLMDSGGYIDFYNGGIAKIRVFSEALMKDIYLLVRSIGGYVVINTLGNVYTLSIYPPPGVNPFLRLGLATNYTPPDKSPVPPRFISHVQKEGELSSVTCLDYSSPTSLIITNSLTGLDYISSICTP